MRLSLSEWALNFKTKLKNIKDIKREFKAEDKKHGLHPRNRHTSRYDFQELSNSLPELKKFVLKNKYNDESIDFANPDAVKSLNRAILKHFYNINNWDIPKNYLCPPIPGRADYIHQIADLLGANNNGNIPRGESIRVLDIGVGANCVYPLIANHEYEWSIVGSDIDSTALKNAEKIILANQLDKKIRLRIQNNTNAIFKGILQNEEFFDLTISNPPFHSSPEEAQTGTQRKIKNLKLDKKSALNFGGQSNELWCKGGELSFITQMIKESLDYKQNCFWFTTLVSKSATLPHLYDELKKANVQNFKTIDMAQGQKKSRVLAWTFLTPNQQQEWRELKK